jgi:hypothetical protein
MREFFLHLGVEEGQFQFLHIEHGIRCKGDLFPLASNFLGTGRATDETDIVPIEALPEQVQFRMAWCIEYLCDDGNDNDYAFTDGLWTSMSLAPFNIETLEYYCFSLFCAKLGQFSNSDIHRIFCTYKSFDYHSFCSAVLNGNFGHLNMHDKMNIRGRHNLLQAVAWMEGVTECFGGPLVNNHWMEEKNPYMRFQNFDMDKYLLWCHDNQLENPNTFQQDHPRRPGGRLIDPRVLDGSRREAATRNRTSKRKSAS